MAQRKVVKKSVKGKSFLLKPIPLYIFVLSLIAVFFYLIF